MVPIWVSVLLKGTHQVILVNRLLSPSDHRVSSLTTWQLWDLTCLWAWGWNKNIFKMFGLQTRVVSLPLQHYVRINIFCITGLLALSPLSVICACPLSMYLLGFQCCFLFVLCVLSKLYTEYGAWTYVKIKSYVLSWLHLPDTLVLFCFVLFVFKVIGMRFGASTYVLTSLRRICCKSVVLICFFFF